MICRIVGACVFACSVAPVAGSVTIGWVANRIGVLGWPVTWMAMLAISGFTPLIWRSAWRLWRSETPFRYLP